MDFSGFHRITVNLLVTVGCQSYKRRQNRNLSTSCQWFVVSGRSLIKGRPNDLAWIGAACRVCLRADTHSQAGLIPTCPRTAKQRPFNADKTAAVYVWWRERSAAASRSEAVKVAAGFNPRMTNAHTVLASHSDA